MEANRATNDRRCFAKPVLSEAEGPNITRLIVLTCPIALLLTLSGCTRSAKNIDACELLTRAEVEAIQQSPVREVKPSTRTESSLRISQCFYTTADFSKSVAVTVTQRDPESNGPDTPKDFWKERFHEHRVEPGEEGRSSVPPKKIDNLGEEAYWTSGIGAALYVLNGEVFLRIAVGASGSEETRLAKAKALAEKTLKHL